METIVFDGARSRSHSIVRLAPTSRYIGWEIVCFGRPASEVRFDSGQYRSSLEVLLDDRPLLIEHARVRGGGRELAGPWGYADYPVSATWLCVAPDTSALGQITDEVRATLSGRPELRAAISHFDGAVVLRIQSKSVEAARRVLVAAWAQARPSIMGRSACEPRIWHT
jgi:urease accessory protein